MTAATIPARVWLWLLFACHLIIASTFITKYGVRYGFDPLWTSGLYCALAVMMLLIYRRWNLLSIFADGRFLFATVALLTCMLAVFMYHFDIEGIRNGRHAALDLAVSRLASGEFPYQAPAFSTHSAFPGWILLATPFYLMGDSGVMVLLALPLLVWTLWQLDRASCLPGILFLVSAPQFLYDVAVRSDIAVNLIAVMAVIAISEKLIAHENRRSTILAGVITGLLLSSRGVAMVAFTAYIGYTSLNRRKQTVIYGLSAIATSLATVVPFAIWDWRNFVDWGPIGHQIQLSHLPVALLGLAIAVPFFVGRRTKSFYSLIVWTATILVMIVIAAAVRGVSDWGLEVAIMESGFDVTYLTIPLPFMILAILLTRAVKPALDSQR